MNLDGIYYKMTYKIKDTLSRMYYGMIRIYSKRI